MSATARKRHVSRDPRSYVNDDFSSVLALNFAHLSRSSDSCWDDNETVKSSPHRLSTHCTRTARREKGGARKDRKRKRKREAKLGQTPCTYAHIQRQGYTHGTEATHGRHIRDVERRRRVA